MTYPAGSRRFIALVGALTGLTALSIDISLPALPLIGDALHATAAQTQLTLSAFLMGYAASQLVIGPFSDSLGRKPVLLASLALFTLAGIACTFATSIEALIICRVLQGIGASAGTILGRAIVRDSYEGTEAARVLALVTLVMFIAPMVAPLIGTVILHVASWRMTMGFLAVTGLLCIAMTVTKLGESLPPDKRRSLSATAVAASYGRFFASPASLIPAIVVCAAFACQFAYIGSSSFVMLEVFRQAPKLYPFFFGANALMLMVGSRLAAYLVRERNPRQVLSIGAAIMALGATVLLLCVLVRDGGTAGYVTGVAITFVGIGMSIPSALAVAMEPWKAAAGLAASALGAAQMGGGAIASAVTGAVYDGTARPVAMVMAGTGALVFAASLLLVGQRVLQRDR